MNFSEKLIQKCSIAAAFFVLVIIYLHHFQNGFFYDDTYCIQQNPAIHSLKNITKFFKSSDSFATIDAYKVYRPFFLVSYAVDYYLGNGLKPSIIHLHTFIGFLFLCVFFFLFAKKIFENVTEKPFYPAFLAVCIFAFHPTTADVLNYMYARCDSFGALYGMFSIVLYLYSPLSKKYFLYLIPLFIGCLFKINALLFAPILGIYLLFFDESLGDKKITRWKNIVLRMIPPYTTIIFAFILTVVCGRFSDTNGLARSTSLMTQAHVILNYFMLFFLPENINPNGWRNFIESPTDYRFIVGVVFLIVMAGCIYISSLNKLTKPIAFGLQWFFIFLVPSSIFLILTVPQVDYYVFDSMMGLSIAISGFVLVLYKKLEKKKAFSRVFLIAGCLGVLASFAYGSRQRVNVWSSNKAMWEDVLKKDPTNGRILMNYGTLLMAEGKLPDAEQYFEKAKTYWPSYDLIYVNMGIIKDMYKDTVGAESNYKQAVALNGWDYYIACYYYGAFLHRYLRDDEAAAQLSNALQKNPSYTDAAYLLMGIYLQHKNKELGNLCRRFLSISSDDSIGKKYLAIYSSDSNSFGNSSMSQNDIEAFYMEHPSESNYLSLSIIYFNKKEFDRVVEVCDKLLAINPKSAEAYNNICAAYNNMQDWNKAIIAGKKALELKPDFDLAKNNLSFALSQANNSK